MSVIERAFAEFQKELKAEFVGIEELQYPLFIRKISLEALRRVVLKTPVDTGRARANWQLTTGSPAEGVIDAKDKQGAKTLRKGANEVAKIKGTPVVYITNNVDYIEVLEQGSSSQAPQGMVAVTISELKAMFS